MQEYATVLLYAIPFFVLLIAIEHFVALYKRENINIVTQKTKAIDELI